MLYISQVSAERSSREPEDPGYVALKVHVNDYIRGDEVAVYDRIKTATATAKHSGHEAIRKLFSSFEVQGLQGKMHTCIVHEALGMTMDRLLDHLPNRSFRIGEMKPFLRQLLTGLDFLHDQARIIHTGKDVSTSP